MKLERMNNISHIWFNRNETAISQVRIYQSKDRKHNRMSHSLLDS